MTTEKKTEAKSAESESTTSSTKNTTDNKSVFGPLGKYAVIAVIMVSIIVTTATMLNKELDSVEEELAAIENEVAEMNTVTTETVITEPVESTKTVAEIVTEADINTAEPEFTEDQNSETVSANEIPAGETSTKTAPESELTAIAPTTDTASPETTRVETNAVAATQERQSQPAVNNHARIEAYKTEQKKRMSEMFARIKSLEAQQLDRYQTSQNKQIEQLRNQNAKQQQRIEKLVSRNKDMYELRSANLQRNQENREQILNRI